MSNEEAELLADLRPAHAGERLTIVSAGLRAATLESLSHQLSPGGTLMIIDTDGFSHDFRARRARKSVDIDAIAPRLREIQLPSAVVNADRVVAAIDIRGDATRRPDLALGLWAKMVPSRSRLAARLSGPREGLTAEFLLARPPDQILIIDAPQTSGPSIAIIGLDLIAVEVMALSMRDVRSALPSSAPAPWEDPLVQRATELQLGCSGPGEILISTTISSSMPPSERDAVRDLIARAAGRAGVDAIDQART